MRIIHILNSGFNGNITGITEVVTKLSENQRKTGNEVFVFFLDSCNGYDFKPTWTIVNNDKEFCSKIKIINPNLVIFHSFYNYSYIKWSSILKRMRIPYLIEMHGSSTENNQKKSIIRKKIANLLFFNKFVKNSNGIIYLNDVEFKNSIFKDVKKSIIIPNGCDLPIEKKYDTDNESNILHFLFLARIDINHKGIDLLIEGIKLIYNRIKGKVIFDFYGYCYDNKFQEMIEPYNDVIKYHGPAFGEDKKKAFESADIFVLTSRYEGMPISILEALSYSLPCLITPETNMSDIIKDKAGWIVEGNSKLIANEIINIINTPRSQLIKMQRDARDSVKLFSWNEIAKLSIIKYKSLL